MIERGLAVRTPAKINLSLAILGRRPDGFHELDTLFQAIDLWDRLELWPAAELGCRWDGAQAPAPDDRDNLVLRAARRLVERAGPSRKIAGQFRLSKRIPIGAGLGGGSSDAAAALLLGNRFWELGLHGPDLESLARELGADVPFFLIGGTARGTGRGDRIEPLAFPGPTPVLLGFPPFGLETAEVFRRAALRLTPSGNGVSVPRLIAHKWPQTNDFGLAVNDLEPVVFEGWPELRCFRDAMREAGAEVARMSGSGSTIYGLFADSREMAAGGQRLRERFPDWRLVETRFVPDGVRWESGSGAEQAGPWEP